MSHTEWPTEHMATVAVDAAARKAYEEFYAREVDRANRMGVLCSQPTWEALDDVQKTRVRESVLSTVWAALEALPDPRRAAWTEGNAAGYREASLPGEQADDNPYA